MLLNAPDYDGLVERIRFFAEARAWGPFHNPKNLAMAIASEAGELLAELRWLSPYESMPDALSAQQMDAISMEMADVFIFLVRMADVLGIDLRRTAEKKLDLNEDRFPAD